jgi:hypothetical protein
MIEINLSESAGAVRPLFKETVPDGPRLFSALNSYHPAIALADSADNPNWCVLRSGWFGRTFIGGEIKPDALGLAVQQLRKTGQVLLDLGDHRSTNFPFGATKIEPRIEFYDRSPDDASVDRLIASVPATLNVRPVMHETFNHCAWRDQLLAVFGTASGYLERSIGFLLLDGKRILSEAHAFFWGDTVVEIGVITTHRLLRPLPKIGHPRPAFGGIQGSLRSLQIPEDSERQIPEISEPRGKAGSNYNPKSNEVEPEVRTAPVAERTTDEPLIIEERHATHGAHPLPGLGHPGNRRS